MLPCRGARRHMGLSGVHFLLTATGRERNSAACARRMRATGPPLLSVFLLHLSSFNSTIQYIVY
jgi:hypothetical protein